MRRGFPIPGLLAAAALVVAFGLLAERALRTVRLEAEARVRTRLEASAAESAAAAAARLDATAPGLVAAEGAWCVDADGRFTTPPEPEPIPPSDPPAGAPDRLVFWLDRAATAERTGEPDVAADYYGQAAGPGAPDAVARVALARRAALEERRGNADEARALWARVAPIAGDTELLPAAAAGGADVAPDRLVAWLVAHLGAEPAVVPKGWARELGLLDHPAVRGRLRALARMDALRGRLLPLPPDGETRFLRLPDGEAAVQRGDRIAVLDAADAAALLGPDAAVAAAPAPAAPGEIVATAAGAGPLAAVVFAARAGPEEVDAIVRRQAALLLGAAGIAAAVSIAGLAFVLRGARRASELARLKTEFVANVSHELRAPLALVRLYAETLRSGRAPEGEEAEYLSVVEREAAGLTRLVDRVLDFARIERGEKDYRRDPADLAALLREIADAAPERYPGLDVAAEIPDRPVPARIDREAVAAAVGNLLDNAAKHGGGGRVDLALIPNGAAARIEVRDRGPGVPAAEAERIFERFHRGPAATKGGVRGSGLGLTLVRHAAEGHGGRAGVRDRDGGGAVFWMDLPGEEGE